MRPADVKLKVEAVAVVVPARDERELIGSCLDAIAGAVRRVAHRVVTVVVLDRCTDDTHLELRNRPVLAVSSTAGCVGAARAAGVRAGLEALGDVAPECIWLANTDADSIVDPSWLSHQIDLADAGADLALGTVRLHPDSATSSVASAWAASYHSADGHRHVHGANLGVRASAYLRAGGFAPVPVDEDVQLARAVGADPRCVVVRSAAAPVGTSGRLAARAPAGFASYLRALESRAG